MSHAIKLDESRGIVELTFDGTITAADMHRASDECIALQRSSGVTRFLVDANHWDLEASKVDIYELPSRKYWKESVDKRTRVAIILPAAATARQGAQFYQDACQNRGWNARVLPDRGSAIAWLRKR